MKSVFVIGPVKEVMIKSVKHEQMPHFFDHCKFTEQFTFLKICTLLLDILKNAMFMQFLDIWRCIDPLNS